MSSPSCSTAASKNSAPHAVFMIFTLATLLEVTSVHPVLAQQSQTAVTASAVLVATAAEDDDKDDGKDDGKAMGDKGDKGDDDDGTDAQNFQQPVRVGDLIGRDVIAPLESQDLLGHVVRLVRHDDDITVVVSTGGHLGFGTHSVCVAADSLALTGYALQAKDISTEDLATLPRCDGSGDTPIDPDTKIKMTLAKPAH